MAKAKRKRGKASMMTKGINVLTLFIGLSPVVRRLLINREPIENLVYLYSAGMSTGVFDQAAALEAYGPLAGAIAFKKAVSLLRKTARI